MRASADRFAATCHGEEDSGFMATIVSLARDKGVSAYVGDGGNRWPAVHRLDPARLFRVALEKAPAGSALHAVGEEGVAIGEVDEVIGRHLGVPVAAISPQVATEHFGFLAGFVAMDGPASSALTQAQLDWTPTGPGLIEDPEAGFYFEEARPRAS